MTSHMADADLQKRLEKLGNQLVTDIEQWEQSTRADRQRVMEQFTHSIGDQISKAMGKVDKAQQKAIARHEKREAKRKAREERKRNQGSVIGGVFAVLAAFLCGAFAVLRPDVWWLIFIGLALFLSGGQQLAAAFKKTNEPKADAHEVDVLCDQLLADLKSSPEAVRAFISDPERTVKTMRATLKALDQRRAQLLAEDAPAKLKEASGRRGELVMKRDAATDAQARQRLGDAIEGLDGQVAALRQLAAVTERVDGEYTALLVRLQELKTRVAVARSSGTQVQLDGLRASVSRLNEELGAIGEAMQMAQVVDVGTGEGADGNRSRVRV